MKGQGKRGGAARKQKQWEYSHKPTQEGKRGISNNLKPRKEPVPGAFTLYRYSLP